MKVGCACSTPNAHTKHKITDYTAQSTPSAPGQSVLLPSLADQLAVSMTEPLDPTAVAPDTAVPSPPPPPPPPGAAAPAAAAASAPIAAAPPEKKRGTKRRRAPFDIALEDVLADKTPREMTPEEKSLIGRIYLAFKKNGYATRDFDALLKATGYDVNQATYIHWARVLEERGEAVSSQKKKRARTVRSSPYALRLSSLQLLLYCISFCSRFVSLLSLCVRVGVWVLFFLRPSISRCVCVYAEQPCEVLLSNVPC